MRLTDLADGLRAHGLKVVEEPGWKTRGASGGAQMKGVRGVLWHHDVAPAKGTYPLRTMLRQGRPGLSGPLCHLGFDRDGVVHVVGAGKANHAGKGIVPGVPRNTGNVYLIGIEMTSTGRGDWTDAQLREMPKLGAALSRMYGLSADQHWGHSEYTPRKVDPYGLPGGMAGLRSRIREAMRAPAKAGKAATQAVQTAGKVAVDGRYGVGTHSEVQRRRGRPVDGRLGAGDIRDLQAYFALPQDGQISNQVHTAEQVGNAIVPSSWEYDPDHQGPASVLVRCLQAYVGAEQDRGQWYEGLSAAIQRFVNRWPAAFTDADRGIALQRTAHLR